MKVRSGCKNLNDQVRSSRPTTEDLDFLLKCIEDNPSGNYESVSDELSFSQAKVDRYLSDLNKCIRMTNYTSHYKTIDNLFIYLNNFKDLMMTIIKKTIR